MFSVRTFVTHSKFFQKNFSFKTFQIRSLQLTATARMSKTKVAVVQLNSKECKEDNFAIAKQLIESAHRDGAKMAFLPECFDMIAPSKEKAFQNGEPIDGPLMKKYEELARTHDMWLSLGGLHERNPKAEDRKLFNAHVVIDNTGKIVSIYRKVHLFNLDIPGTRLVESEFSQAGNAILKPVDTPAGTVGLGICYDVRFAEQAIALAKGGAQILTYPSSFTVPTGKAHWEVLLRARAIETQCYVIAAGQCGQHNTKRSSYGHSMIIDPWGVVLAHLTADEPGYAVAEIDLQHLKEMRSRLPVWTDRKPELYGYIIPAEAETIESKTYENFHFGPQAIVKDFQVFAKTPFSVGFVNHRPVLPGHVLVSPIRSGAKRVSDLQPAEIFDMFSLVQRVQRAIEKEFGANSSTVAIQDGIDAGQSVEHLHVHILPRKPTDFGGKNDAIYAVLQQHDDADNPLELRLLSSDEMTNIGRILRSYF